MMLGPKYHVNNITKKMYLKETFLGGHLSLLYIRTAVVYETAFSCPGATFGRSLSSNLVPYFPHITLSVSK